MPSLILTALAIFLYAIAAQAAEPAEKTEQAQTNAAEKTNSATEIIAQSPFTYSLDELAQRTRHDQISELNINSNRHLLFTQFARGSKLRGDVLLFSDSATPPFASSFTGVLAQQLTRLGWNVHAVTIVQATLNLANQEKKLASEPGLAQGEEQGSDADTAKQASADNQPADRETDRDTELEKYQLYFAQLFDAAIESPPLAGKPLLIIGHGDSSYWLLQPLVQNQRVSYFVMLMPRLPQSVTRERLFKQFASQSLPLYLFLQRADDNNPFMRGLAQKKWRHNNIRISSGTFDPFQLQPVDSRIAKMITGWVETSIRK